MERKKLSRCRTNGQADAGLVWVICSNVLCNYNYGINAS